MADITGFPYFEVESRLDASLFERRGPQVVSFGLRAVLRCDQCRTDVPVAAIAPELPCPGCGHAREMDAETWASLFDEGALKTALQRPEGVGGEAAAMDGAFQARYRRCAPFCHGCQRPLGGDELAQAMSGPSLCSCGHPIPLRPADDLARAISPGARWVLDGAQSLAAKTRADRPIVFACMQCSGALKVDGSARTVPCSYCGADNFLPDALWHKLAPKPVVREMYLLTELDERTWWSWLLCEREVRPLVRMWDTLPGGLPAAAVAVLAEGEDDARALAGSLRSAPPETLQRLARDPEPAVRAAVAGNPMAREELLRELFRDDAARVREGLARHPRLPIELVGELIDLGRAGRAALAGRADVKQMPAEWQARLGREPRAALANPAFSLEHLAVDAVLADRDCLPALILRLEELTETQRTALAEGCTDPRHAELARALAGSPQTPPAALSRLGLYPEEAVRMQVASHDRAPLELLRALEHDRAEKVASAARGNARWTPKPLWRRLMGL